jgi:hypothetical protein
MTEKIAGLGPLSITIGRWLAVITEIQPVLRMCGTKMRRTTEFICADVDSVTFC